MKYIWLFLGLFLVQGCSISIEQEKNEPPANEGTYGVATTPESSTANDLEVKPAFEAKTGKVRTLPRFHSLLHNVAGNVVWKQGDEQRVEIQAVSEVIEQVVTEVKEGGLLYVGFRDSNYQLNDNKLYIFITTPNIKAIRLSGSGNLQSKNRWDVDKLSLAISGSGNMDIRLKANKVTADLLGSGNINLKGKADKYVLDMSGAGNIAGHQMKVDQCKVLMSGSGSCVLTVKETLDVYIKGSGFVTYKGNPVLTKKVDGSGNVVKAK